MDNEIAWGFSEVIKLNSYGIIFLYSIHFLKSVQTHLKLNHTYQR
jgi:hypothetical protein